MGTLVFLLLALTVVAAVPSNPQRIVGGADTTIDNYPDIAALLYSWNLSTYSQACGGIIINTRTVLTAAHCVHGDPVESWRIRVGTTTSNAGGATHLLLTYICHHEFNHGTFMNNDIAILRSVNVIAYRNNAIQPGIFAGSNYRLPNDEVVWAAGWGRISTNGPLSTTLRHVQVWTVYQRTCSDRYRDIAWTITDNMLCSGWLEVGGRDQCLGDSGGPLYHNGVVVGVYSFGYRCGVALFPSVNTRVSRYTKWIKDNAVDGVVFVNE